ncbi:GGDEF domain-containing protein [Flagellimonas sp. S3867]|uniref:GGDEF domain-containing protein n=1 Tax=Flagellimonas sp. S3867 TaxID=2768063 RepID=UPI001CC2655A|nr:GGDEF domain-containing protein [Flagellimonas sp. S3867]
MDILSYILIIVLLCTTFYYRRLYLNRSNRDSLTGLYNGTRFTSFLKKKIKTSRTNSVQFSLILVDIDDFKDLNDTVGYLIADQYLQKVVRIILDVIGAGEYVFRQYTRGDEFIVICPNAQLSYALEISNVLRKKVNEEFLNSDLNLSISCGVTEHKKEENYEDLLKRVYVALREAKSKCNKNTSIGL